MSRWRGDYKGARNRRRARSDGSWDLLAEKDGVDEREDLSGSGKVKEVEKWKSKSKVRRGTSNLLLPLFQFSTFQVRTCTGPPAASTASDPPHRGPGTASCCDSRCRCRS